MADMARELCLIVALVFAVSGFAGEEENATASVEIVTSMGAMTVELWPDKAPLTVENFLERVDGRFYDGLIFHRVIANFMIQGGGFDAQMNEREAPRTVVNESANGERNRRWTIAMARRADPDSAGAQFYINTKDNPHLDARPGQPGYAVFGELTAGMEVAEDIELTDTGQRAGFPSVPLNTVTIETIRRVEPSSNPPRIEL